MKRWYYYNEYKITLQMHHMADYLPRVKQEQACALKRDGRTITNATTQITKDHKKTR